MPEVAAGGMALAGTLLTNSANEQMTAETNATNMAIAKQQEDFQERMSDTAYQRGTADMKAAGINPMLAISQGGASAPTGASIAAQAPHADNALGAAVASATQAAQADAQVKAQQSQADVNKTSAALNTAQIGKVTADTNLSNTANSTAQAQLNAVNAEAQLRTANAKTGLKYQGYDQFMNRAKIMGNTINSAVGAFSGFGSLIPQGDGQPTIPGYMK